MAKKTPISISVGGAEISVSDDAIFEYLAKNSGREAEAVRVALLCGIEAIGIAAASRHSLTLDAHFQQVASQINAFAQAGVAEVQSAILRATTASDKESLISQVTTALEGRAGAILKSIDPENPDSVYGRFTGEMRALVRDISQASAREDVRKEMTLKTTGKGRTFEEDVVAALAGCLAGTEATIESTGAEIGMGASKKGDAVIRCCGGRKAIVVEAKRAKISLSARFIDEELRAGIANRGANAAILVVHPEHAACIGAPVKFLADDIIACVYEPGGDVTALFVAYQVMDARVAREKSGKAVVGVARLGKRLTELASKIESLSVLERAMARSIDDLDSNKSAVGTLRRALQRECGEIIDEFECEKLNEPAAPVENAPPELPCGGLGSKKTVAGPLLSGGPATLSAEVADPYKNLL